MSTILDALRKLQRERAAESPSRDLRGSLTTETPRARRPRRSGSARWVMLALVVAALGGGGYWLYGSGRLDALRARFGGGAAGNPDAGDVQAQIEDLDTYERQVEARREGSAPAAESAGEAVAEPESAPQVAAPPVAQAPAAQAPPAAPGEPRVDTPETLAERARLEAALVNARTAQEKQRQQEAEAAAEAATAAAAIASQPAPTPAPEAPAATPTEKKPVVVAKAAPPAKAKPATSTPATKAAPAPARAAAAPKSAPAAASAPFDSAFPEVTVESIRWHPMAERRVASLRFERQNVPQAHEGDIVAGVLVYRIDPGAVELRVGTAHRVISPAP